MRSWSVSTSVPSAVRMPAIDDSAIHRGADLMFRRRWRGELADRFPTAAPHARMHFMPPGTGAGRVRVVAGQPLGVVGADPKDANAIAHLHFELWHGGNGLAAIDPTPYLARWAVVDPPEVA